MRVMACGGRTGGHIYPILAVASALARSVKPLELAWLGSGGELEEEILAPYGFPRYPIAAAGVRGLGPGRALANLAKLGRGTVEACRAMRAFQPEVLFITGGYGAIPAALAARVLGVPALMYLPDMEPGLAVRALAHLVDRVAISFPEVREHWRVEKAVVTGYPVRDEIGVLDKGEARQELGLDRGVKVLLVLGGSQGAHSINLAIQEAAEGLLGHYQLLHIAGSSDFPWLREWREGLPPQVKAHYHLYAFLHQEMPEALAAADLAVARAGAAVLGEFPAAGLPAVLVPYPHAGAHQEANAAFLVAKGAALTVKDGDLEQGTLGPLIEGLLADDAARGKMAEAAKELARPQAAQELAEELAKLAEGACNR